MSLGKNLLELEIERQQLKAIWIAVLTIIGSILIGYGSNWQIGTGAFFLMWAHAGIGER